ncbi:RNA polymerase subunit sigma-24 [Paenibacillus paeoniae]|uniref:RNA polymerase subunit sigma-24 n=2 Tax=Paenibacillus paeoniae TaxID=2292705 RepID=A0A371PNQ4_9BACL|nr:RNA polymerase subunit sigma-24 [Paenibacillus paeoniae]
MVQMYSDMVLRLALTYLRNISDAQDICQDVFLKIYKYRKEFADSEHEKAWIIRVTINGCKDELRRPWRKRNTPLHETSLPIQDVKNKEVVSHVLNLPEKYRVIIYLFYFESYSTYEIAKLLNRRENTVRTQLKRARELLKHEIKGGIEDE